MRRNKSQECHEQWAFRIVPGVWTCLLGLPQVVKKTLTVVRTSPEKPNRCANIFGPNMFLRPPHFTALLVGVLALSSCHAQTDSIAASPEGQWWKGLFRPEGGTDMTPGAEPTSPEAVPNGQIAIAMNVVHAKASATKLVVTAEFTSGSRLGLSPHMASDWLCRCPCGLHSST